MDGLKFLGHTAPYSEHRTIRAFAHLKGRLKQVHKSVKRTGKAIVKGLKTAPVKAPQEGKGTDGSSSGHPNITDLHNDSSRPKSAGILSVKSSDFNKDHKAESSKSSPTERRTECLPAAIVSPVYVPNSDVFRSKMIEAGGVPNVERPREEDVSDPILPGSVSKIILETDSVYRLPMMDVNLGAPATSNAMNSLVTPAMELTLDTKRSLPALSSDEPWDTSRASKSFSDSPSPSLSVDVGVHYQVPNTSPRIRGSEQDTQNISNPNKDEDKEHLSSNVALPLGCGSSLRPQTWQLDSYLNLVGLPQHPIDHLEKPRIDAKERGGAPAALPPGLAVDATVRAQQRGACFGLVSSEQRSQSHEDKGPVSDRLILPGGIRRPPEINSTPKAREEHLERYFSLVVPQQDISDGVFRSDIIEIGLGSCMEKASPINYDEQSKLLESDEDVNSLLLNTEVAEPRKSEAEQNIFGGLRQLMTRCQSLEKQLYEARAEAAEYKEHFLQNEHESTATKQVAAEAIKENGVLRKKLGEMTSEALYCHTRLQWFESTCEDESLEGYVRNDVVKLQHEIQCQEAATKHSLQELKQAQVDHADEMTKKDVEIEHLQEIIARRESQVGVVIRQGQEYRERVARYIEAATAPMNSSSRERIPEILAAVEDKAEGWQDICQQRDITISGLERKLLCERKKLSKAEKEIAILRQQREELDIDLERSGIKISELHSRVLKTEEESRVTADNLQAANEELKQDIKHLEQRVDGLMIEVLPEELRSWYDVFRRHFEALENQRDTQAETITKLEHVLTLREKWIPEDGVSHTKHEIDGEIWRRRAQRAEKICEQLSPNPLLKRGSVVQGMQHAS